MRRTARTAAATAALLLGLFQGSQGLAAVILVGVYGSDSATCGPTSPCRTLQYAVNRAAAGDTIFLGNPVNYGSATIAKTLDTVGVNTGGAGIYSPTAPCITVNGAAGVVVTITGITCDQGGAARDGIVFNSGKQLILTDVTLRRGGAGACGIRLSTTTNTFVDFSDVRATEWGLGAACLVPQSSALAGVLNHVSFQDGATGIRALSSGAASIKVTCDRCDLSGGGTGIYASGHGSQVRLKDSRISGNTVGLNHPNLGKIVSDGGNSVRGNATNGTFTP